MFYKARIVRGYLGAANARRLGASPTHEISGLMPPQIACRFTMGEGAVLAVIQTFRKNGTIEAARIAAPIDDTWLSCVHPSPGW